MNVFETLEQVKAKAVADVDFREALLATRNEKNPVSTFCRVCADAGFAVSAMDLVDAGEEAYAAMRRSTNGGGENSPLLQGEDDLYEMFLIGLE
ncbi:MAG: hypothetical protein IJ682_10895 [Lachnospiraceae bacterium]|nr:hypothetical protein [Lachnospiraceae bacterium]